MACTRQADGETMEQKRSKIGWLWENMKGYRAMYVIGIMGTIVYNALQLTVPFVTSIIVDTFLTGKDAVTNLETRRDYLFQLIAAMVLLTFLRTAIVYIVCMDGGRIPEGSVSDQNVSVQQDRDTGYEFLQYVSYR